MRRLLSLLLVAALATLALTAGTAGTAAATSKGVHQIGPTLAVWGIDGIRQGGGDDHLAGPVFTNRAVDSTIDLGPAAFKLPTTDVDGRASALVRAEDVIVPPTVSVEAPTADPTQPDAMKGGADFIDEYREFRKDFSSRDQSLKLTIGQTLLDVIDDNGPLSPAECPVAKRCNSIQGIVKVDVVAYKKGAQHPFFDVGGSIDVEGHQDDWFVTPGTLASSSRAFWEGASFDVNRNVDGDTHQTHFKLDNIGLINITIPLNRVLFRHRFDVRVSVDARAIDDRGLESAAAARVAVFQGLTPIPPVPRAPRAPRASGASVVRQLVRAPRASGARVLHQVPADLKAPPPAPRPAARCPSGRRRHAGQLQLSSHPVTVNEATGSALVFVTRTGGARGAASAVLSTTNGTARAGSDFTAERTLVRFENGEKTPRIVEIPIREDRAVESPETFRLSLRGVRCASLGARRSADAMILDDDQPAPPPSPTFTIGGTVDGLQGTGLVLSNLGGPVTVSANGPFTFPGTASDGQPYEVKVATQPQGPRQLCTVDNGAGTVSGVNVTNIAVHCTTPALPAGLDGTFGDGGRVTTPGNGDGNAVVIQPDGRIVTVGPREVGNNFHFDFGATRHDDTGHLDTSFGTGGIATTDLGGNDDKARDAALLPDGGFVAVGEADPAGLANVDFGVVRYTADGHPDPSFNSTGVETTDIAGRGDVANAVAVQPDGKIVAAGEAETAPGLFDFALVRYNPDGTRDTSFDGDGIVTTDLGGQNDDAVAVTIQPDGKIVAVGSTDKGVGIVRYLPNGALDPTFNSTGILTADLGMEAHGATVTPGGSILVVGTGAGPNLTSDVRLASFGANGKLTLGFGQLGVVDTDLSGGFDSGEDLVLDASGRIIVVGDATSSTSTDMPLVRYNTDGSLDPSFGSGGVITADFNGSGDFGHDVTIDSQGRIVAAGTGAGGFALMRANP